MILVKEKRLLGENLSPAPDDRRVVPPRRLDRTLLRLVVDVDDTEALGIAVRPLIVVEQRPRVVSAQVDALLYRFVRRAQMLAVVLDAQRIFNASVDGVRRIVKRGA